LEEIECTLALELNGAKEQDMITFSWTSAILISFINYFIYEAYICPKSPVEIQNASRRKKHAAVKMM
jgi:hypothetical protein